MGFADGNMRRVIEELDSMLDSMSLTNLSIRRLPEFDGLLDESAFEDRERREQISDELFGIGHQQSVVRHYGQISSGVLSARWRRTVPSRQP